jgi:tight adherence protein C
MTMTNLWFLLLGIVLLLSSIGALLLSTVGQKNFRGITEQRMNDILSADPGRTGALSGWKRWVARVGAKQKGVTAGARLWQHEVQSLLSKAGFHQAQTRILVNGGMALAPVAAAALVLVAVVGAGDITAHGAAIVFFGFGAGMLLPRHALRYMAARRCGSIKEEIPIMVRLISVLFDAGLSLENALRILRDEGRWILPNLSVEIGRVLARIASGMDRVEAMEQVGRELDIQELTDAISVLSHASTAGGAVRQSLTQIADIIEDHNRTQLRERVGQLSAKMTVVMVVFLFPALFIFLAGPGFVAIAGALGGLK